MAKKKPRCGVPTGLDRSGPPCRRVVQGGGPCHLHDDSAQEQLDGQKERILRLLRDGEHTLEDAATEVGVNRTTVWRWQKADADFAAAIDDLDGERVRLRLVEGSVYRQILGGRAAAALTIFWMVNVSNRVEPGRWQHVQHILQSNMDVNLAGLPEQALERIAGGEDVVRVVADVLRERQLEDLEP